MHLYQHCTNIMNYTQYIINKKGFAIASNGPDNALFWGAIKCEWDVMLINTLTILTKLYKNGQLSWLMHCS